MHKITALSAQKRNPQRVNVYLDGEFAFGLARIVAAWLQVGQEVSDEKIAQLQLQDEDEMAYQRALRYLDYRPRSEAEMRRYLVQHKVSENTIEEVLQRLRQNHLVDDAKFAEMWIENRAEWRPRGRRALAYELHQRGIGAELADQLLEEIDENDLAQQAARKYMRKLEGLEWRTFRQKMIAFLARRGFNYEVSASVTTQMWAELENTPDNMERN